MKTIEIVNWDECFENSESRKYKNLKWLPLPNKHDGEGWARLWQLKNSSEIFAAFILMLELASKCPKRGVINKDGKPLGPEEMALKTRAPRAIFELAIQPLIEIGWIKMIDHPKKSP